MPIGDDFTIGINDAILASDFVACNKILGCHFNTFGYIEIDDKVAKQKFYNNAKDLILLEIVESVDL